MTTDYLEPDYLEPYETWQKDQTPAGNAAILKAVDPVLQKGIRANVGEPNPLANSRARQIALKSLRSYDRSRSRLQTHLMNNLQSLRRAQRQASQVVRAPEQVILQQSKLREIEQELQDEYGREPTDLEIADRSGMSLRRIGKVRSWRPGMAEGQAEQVDPSLLSAMGVGPSPEAQDAWVQLVYEESSPIDRKIMEYTLGLNGRPRKSNQEIALLLGRSPGAISQRKVKIQEALDQEQDLSPFLG